MKLRYFFFQSLLLVGLLSACTGNTMNEVGRDTNNLNNTTTPTRVSDNRDYRGGDDRGFRVNDQRVMDDNRGYRINNNRGNRTDQQINNNQNATDGLVNDRNNTTRVRSDRDDNNDTLNRNMNNATRDYSNKGRLGNDNNPSDKGNNTDNLTDINQPNMRVADKVADRIAAMKEVDAANVLVTENNAYVAAKLEPGQELSNKLERKISNHVKSVDGDIDNVYVSVNADFYDRTTTYAQDIRQGRPISGFFNEFTETIRRLFPNNVQ